MNLPYVSPGNRKMPMTPTYSTPAIQTCPKSTPLCRKLCYALKAERAYPQVKPCRTANLQGSKRDAWVELMIEAIKARTKRTRFFRIHESGDFYNQEYVDKWFEVCRALPDLKFLAFTKSDHLDYSDCPSNLVLWLSVWEDSKLLNAGQFKRRAYAGHVGPTGAFECEGACDDCRFCWNKNSRSVHFTFH